MNDVSPTENNAVADAAEEAAGAVEAQHENGNGVAAAEAASASDEAFGGDDGVGDAKGEHDSKDKGGEGMDTKEIGDFVKSEEEQKETVDEKTSSTEPTGAPKSIKVEELPAAVRARMDEVLHVENDKTMRQDTRLINFLGEVEESQALAALNEYHSAVSETSVMIRNKPAYLMGILRKYKQGQRPSSGNGMGGNGAGAGGFGGSGMGNGAPRMGAGPDGLAPKIAVRMEKLFKSKFVSRDDVDQRCLDFFRDLTEQQAEAAMDEFAQSDIVSIRNKSAFLMSILRKHHSSGPPRGGPGSIYGPGSYGGGHMLGYGGFMDPSMMAHAPLTDFYGTGYGPPQPVFNAYGQPIPPMFPQMPVCPSGQMEVLPANIQYRLDQLCASGFCRPVDIDDRCRKFLREVPEPVAFQAIDEFSTVDRGYIRKVSAYFMGVIRKHADQYKETHGDMSGGVEGQMRDGFGGGMKRGRDFDDPYGSSKVYKAEPGDGVMQRLSDAPGRVKTGVQGMLLRGIVSEHEMDYRVTNAILQLTEEQGVAAIEEFSSCDMSRIRNKSAYLMGLLKRYRTGGPPPPGLNSERY